MKPRIVRLKLTPHEDFIGMDAGGEWHALGRTCEMILYRILDKDIIDTAWNIPVPTAHILIKNLNRGNL